MASKTQMKIESDIKFPQTHDDELLNDKLVLKLLKAPSIKFKKPNMSYKLEGKFSLGLEEEDFFGEDNEDVATAVSSKNLYDDDDEEISPIVNKKPMNKASNKSLCKYFNNAGIASELEEQKADVFFEDSDNESDDEDLFGPGAKFVKIHGSEMENDQN